MLYELEIVNRGIFLSRAVCGTRNETLIVNLPGSVKGSQECLQSIISAIPHAVSLMKGRVDDVKKVHNTLSAESAKGSHQGTLQNSHQQQHHHHHHHHSHHHHCHEHGRSSEELSKVTRWYDSRNKISLWLRNIVEFLLTS